MAKDAVDRVLEQWARERPDLDCTPMAVFGRLSRLARVVQLRLEEVFLEHGLNGGEFDVLMTLRRSGRPYQLNPTELFRSMMVASGTMTHRIDQLESVGLVRRIPDPNDRRGRLVQLTPKGHELIDRVLEAHIANEHNMLRGITAEDRKALADLLRKLSLALEG